MTPDRTPPEADAPGRRDTGVRTVTRVTRGVAAAAILGTAVFGGLAASASHSSRPATGAVTASTGGTRSMSDDDATAAQSAVAPATTQQAPVATSGAS